FSKHIISLNCVAYLSLHTILLLCSVHSFPTRRSSDLVRRARLLVVKMRVRLEIRTVTRGTALEIHRAYQIALHQRLEAVVHRRQDRKSTRLNSSHQIISYAVFCLKKKKLEKY